MSGILLGVVGSTFSSPPVNTVAPAVTGTASVGETLTSSTGTWTGAGITYTYQWQHTTTNISGATSSTYVIEVAYLAETIRCVVTATNSAGSSAANSNATSAVAAAAPTYLWAWGKNDYGQLGLGDTANRSSPVQVGALGTWSKVSTSQSSSAITTTGKLYVWGKNNYGQLGLGNTANYSSPKQVGALTNWAVTSTAISSAAIKTNGTLWTWGRNNYGDLGNGTSGFSINVSSPVQVGALTTWSKIAMYLGGAAAITTTGKLYVWGRNNVGQLGLGDTTNRNSPVQVGTLTNWSDISKASTVASTDTSFIATKTDGTLWTWGFNDHGQLSLGDTTNRNSPVQVGTLNTWAVGKLGYKFGLGIKTTGSLWTWGYQRFGQLGSGSAPSSNVVSPVQVGLLTDWPVSSNKVDAGKEHAHAIKTDGKLWNWGYNAHGALGKNDTANTSSPVQLGSLTTWSSISAATGVLAIATHATPAPAAPTYLWAWGDNTNGKLGLGDTVKRSSPVQVGALGTWSNASMSKGSSAAITITGNLFTWGYNNSGKLGNGNTTNYSSPKQVGALTTWSTVAAGQYHMAAIKTDGTLWTWGSSYFGELGLGNTTNYSSPKQIGALTTWSKITAGVRISAAIKTDGTLWAWGYNASGALGLGDVIKRSSPVQVGALTNWSNVSLDTGGSSSTNAIIATKTNGTMWSWGSNDGTQLGVGNGSSDSINRSSPTQIGSATTWGVGRIGSKAAMGIKTDGTLWTWGYNYSGSQGASRPTFGAGSANSGPVQVGLLTDWWSSWNKTSMGWRTGFVIKSDGTLWNWGNNDTGQLGKNNTANTSSPVQLGSLNTWTLVSASAGNGQDTGVLAIATHATPVPSTTLWAWGTNTSGQLGLGDTVNRSSPVQVGALTNWSTLANNPDAAAAIKTDGTLWSWGTGSFGVSGLGNTTNYSSPKQVGSLSTWASVSTSANHRLAIKTDGTLWSWGYNSKGQLGLGDIVNRSSPVQIGTLTTWAKVVGSGRESAAIKTDGTLWTWGWNVDPSWHHADGTLGLGDIINRSSPTQVGALTNWSKITIAGQSYNYPAMIAIKTTGEAWGWGAYARQIGNSQVGNNISSPVLVGGGLTWAKINQGNHYNVNGITTDGKMWVWGQLTRGAGGNNVGMAYGQTTPLQSGALTTWSQVNSASTIGIKHNLAIKTDGTLWAWGGNDNGVLGLGTAAAYIPGSGGKFGPEASSPTQVGSATTWTSITASTHTLGIKTV